MSIAGAGGLEIAPLRRRVMARLHRRRRVPDPAPACGGGRGRALSLVPPPARHRRRSFGPVRRAGAALGPPRRRVDRVAAWVCGGVAAGRGRDPKLAHSRGSRDGAPSRRCPHRWAGVSPEHVDQGGSADGGTGVEPVDSASAPPALVGPRARAQGRAEGGSRDPRRRSRGAEARDGRGVEAKPGPTVGFVQSGAARGDCSVACRSNSRRFGRSAIRPCRSGSRGSSRSGTDALLVSLSAQTRPG